MAHYSGVNESALVNAIISCKSKVDVGAANSLVDSARALPIDGAGATDNIVNAAEEIKSKTSELHSKLEAALGIAYLIADYKRVKKELDRAKANKSRYRNAYNSQTDKTSPIALSYKNKYRNAKLKEADFATQLEQLKSKLSSAGYPPV